MLSRSAQPLQDSVPLGSHRCRAPRSPDLVVAFLLGQAASVASGSKVSSLYEVEYAARPHQGSNIYPSLLVEDLLPRLGTFRGCRCSETMKIAARRGPMQSLETRAACASTTTCRRDISGLRAPANPRLVCQGGRAGRITTHNALELCFGLHQMSSLGSSNRAPDRNPPPAPRPPNDASARWLKAKTVGGKG